MMQEMPSDHVDRAMCRFIDVSLKFVFVFKWAFCQMYGLQQRFTDWCLYMANHRQYHMRVRLKFD